jgi:CBS domain-containing protein
VAQKVREVMTPKPVTLDAGSPVIEAARLMKQSDIGDVIVLDSGKVCGVVTDRDIVVRVVSEGKDASSTKLADICSRDLVSISPDDALDEAIRLMRERAIRRLPVIEKGKPVGIVSIGDLAMERDADSALADISAAPGNA